MIDAARPHFDLVEAAPRQLVADRGGRRQRRGGGRMKVAQRRVGQTSSGTQRARGDIFGKARVVAGGEQPTAFAAIAARRPADRPFGRDMDMVGARRLDAPRDFPGRGEREADIGVGWQRERGKALRGEKDEFGLQLARRRRHLLQSMDDAVDLRAPGVGGDEDPDQAASASASAARSCSTGAASRAASLRSRRASAKVFDQRTISRRPSSCSTTSEQDFDEVAGVDVSDAVDLANGRRGEYARRRRRRPRGAWLRARVRPRTSR